MTEVQTGAGISMKSELWRKALHLLSLLIPAGLLLFGRTTAMWILLPMTGLAVIVEVLRTRSGFVRDSVERVFGFMMRPHEVPPVPAPVGFNGATLVLLTASVLIALFPPPVAAAAIAIGLIGDAAAAVVGRKFGRTKLGMHGKTVEGSLAFVASTLPLLWLVLPGLTLPAIAAGALAGAVTEALHLPVNDNFAVPMAAAIVMTLILQ